MLTHPLLKAALLMTGLWRLPSMSAGIFEAAVSGSLLYEKLEEYLTAQHVCNVCACITYPNPPSIAFHEKHGYKTVAHFHASGYKQDAWHDMIWMEKTLCPHTIPPRPFIPFPEL